MTTAERDISVERTRSLRPLTALTLGTADGSGRPWASPVYYAPEGYGRFYWFCSPEATRSRNIAARPGVAIVIFDSRAPVGRGQGVYLSASAEELSDDDPDTNTAIFSRRSEAHGAGGWTPKDARPPARHRLHRAIASEHSVLGPQDRWTPIGVQGGGPLGGFYSPECVEGRFSELR
jgi:nitroimidazol reductase NimA-like FMN-containing flavoprotein (pyridoxamine 5'-phosphate oxidase superfamily)